MLPPPGRWLMFSKEPTQASPCQSNFWLGIWWINIPINTSLAYSRWMSYPKVNATEVCCWYVKTVSSGLAQYSRDPDSNFHEAHMGSTWVLSGPGGPHVVPMNLAIRGITLWKILSRIQYLSSFGGSDQMHLSCYKEHVQQQKCIYIYFHVSRQYYKTLFIIICIPSSRLHLVCGAFYQMTQLVTSHSNINFHWRSVDQNIIFKSSTMNISSSLSNSAIQI